MPYRQTSEIIDNFLPDVNRLTTRQSCCYLALEQRGKSGNDLKVPLPRPRILTRAAQRRDIPRNPQHHKRGGCRLINFLTLSGFLGAGKTTTLVAAAKLLQSRGSRVAVITNDQGTELIDTQLARSAIAQAGEVTGGCFCCRFEDLLTVAHRLVDEHGVDTLLAEAVGSCTDLQATVIRPLSAHYGDSFTPAPLVVVVEPERLQTLRTTLPLDDTDSDLSYLFGKQLQEADVIALNKVDLLGEDEAAALLADLRDRYPTATVLGYSARSGDGLDQFVSHWLGPSPAGRDLEIDYDRYANAEAALAWLNQSLTVTAAGGFDPDAWARSLLEHVSGAAARSGWMIGHVKISLESAAVLTKMSVTTSGGEPTVDRAAGTRFTEAEVRINARVACEPAELDEAVAEAVNTVTALTGTLAFQHAGVPSFKPGYPQPTYRIPSGAFPG
ncbi:GTP-binding protein [Sphaerisporangium sp. NPDC049003]|uniref:GTP-binding protein n=1 Tax=Sphaerisporangium sp. NPDC049003 TaxID=3364517 RepID=UPI00371F12CA